MDEESRGVVELVRLLISHASALIAAAGACAACAVAGWSVATYFDNRALKFSEDRRANSDAALADARQAASSRIWRRSRTRWRRAGRPSTWNFPRSIAWRRWTCPPTWRRGWSASGSSASSAGARGIAKSGRRGDALRKGVEDWFGGKFQTHPAFQHGVEAVAEAAKAECLLWKGNETVDVAGSDLVKKMYSFVIVRPIRHKAGEDMTTQVLFDFIARQREFDRAIPGMQFKIQVMHRSERKAYLRGFFVFDGLTVDGKPYESYYLMRQIAVVAGTSMTHVIYTDFPNPALGGPSRSPQGLVDEFDDHWGSLGRGGCQ